MRYGQLKLLGVMGAFLLPLTVPPRVCQAGPIIDWLFGNHQPSSAQPVFNQGAALQPPYGQPAGFARPPYYQPGSAQPVYAQPAYAAPSIDCGVPCSPCGPTSRPVITNYQPTYAYRTSWAQMPVTNYRPVASLDATGYPVTTMRPCTTYVWQARRLPTHSVFYPAYTSYASPLAASCSSCGVSPSVPATVPYYAPASPPVTVSPATPRGVTVPGSTTVSPPAGVTSPADLQPSLSPGGLPSSAPTIRNFTPDTPAASPVPVVPADVSPSLPLSSPAAVKKPASGGLRLVPDPDAQPSQDEPNRAPKLLNRDRTAMAPRDRAFTPIRWSGSVRPASAEVAIIETTPATTTDPIQEKPAAPKTASPAAPQYDDSGWRSLRP